MPAFFMCTRENALLTILPTDENPRRASALKAVRELLKFIGEDPDRPGLIETPERVLKAWEESWGAGYREPVKPLVKLFEEEAQREGYSYGGTEMVTVNGIDLYSTCEHHMAPFFGTATISYIPDARGLLGISKLARVVEHFARRLQVQERLTVQIADYLSENVSNDVGIVIECSHMCMVSRGVKQPHAKTVTSALRGIFFDDPRARSEFLALARPGGAYRCD